MTDAERRELEVVLGDALLSLEWLEDMVREGHAVDSEEIVADRAEVVRLRGLLEA